MRGWLVALKCKLLGHKVVVDGVCPVTGIEKQVCLSCNADNLPKHSGGSKFL